MLEGLERPVGAASAQPELAEERATSSVVSQIERRLASLVVSGNLTDRLEISCQHRRGHRLHLAVHLSLITEPGGSLVGALVTLEDRTRHQQVVHALEESEAQFRVIAEAVGDVVYRIAPNPQVRFDYVSPSSVAVLGVTPLQLLNDPEIIVRRSHPDDARSVQDHLAHRGSATLRWRWQHSPGRWRWVEDHRNAIEVGREDVAVVGTIRDVTAEQESAEATQEALDNARRAADELRQVDLMKSTFLAAVSHELRTPLTSILGFSETVARLIDHHNDPQLGRFMGRLVANARRLEQLVDDLLDVDRLTRGQVAPRLAPTNLGELTHRVLVRSEIDDHKVVTDLAAVVADVDAVMIDRVVSNLVRNVRRHTPVGSTMWITVEAVGDTAHIVVADNGPGVPEADRERIFEPFEQGAQSAMAASPGTGIGLSLVLRFVEAHGGRVRIDDRPGGGARFTVDLPLAIAPTALAVAPTD